MVTEVWMVRHTIVDVPVGTCYGRSDVPLRDSFVQEAEVVRRSLAGVRFDAVWCSPLSRCTRLAEACGYPDAVRDERLLEINFGEWEGLSFDRIDDPQLTHWYADYLHARPTGGETFDEQCARVGEFLDELPAAGHGDRREARPGEPQNNVPRRVLVFTHGGVMLAAGIHAGLWCADNAFSCIPPHGSIIKIRLSVH